MTWPLRVRRRSPRQASTCPSARACPSHLRRHAASREHKLAVLQAPDDPLDARRALGVDLLIDDEHGLVCGIEKPAFRHDDSLARILRAPVVGDEHDLQLRPEIDERPGAEGEEFEV